MVTGETFQEVNWKINQTIFSVTNLQCLYIFCHSTKCQFQNVISPNGAP